MAAHSQRQERQHGSRGLSPGLKAVFDRVSDRRAFQTGPRIVFHAFKAAPEAGLRRRWSPIRAKLRRLVCQCLHLPTCPTAVAARAILSIPDHIVQGIRTRRSVPPRVLAPPLPAECPLPGVLVLRPRYVRPVAPSLSYRDAQPSVVIVRSEAKNPGVVNLTLQILGRCCCGATTRASTQRVQDASSRKQPV